MRMFYGVRGLGSATGFDTTDGDSPRTNMQLHMDHLTEPDSAPRFAAAIVETAADISGADLDYSPASIVVVEAIVDGFRCEGVTGEDMADSLVAFGCYVGEILARHAGGAWRRTAGVAGLVPLAVWLPDARECHPVEWVFRRLEDGSDVSIRQLYTDAVHPVPPGGEVSGE